MAQTQKPDSTTRNPEVQPGPAAHYDFARAEPQDEAPRTLHEEIADIERQHPLLGTMLRRMHAFLAKYHPEV